MTANFIPNDFIQWFSDGLHPVLGLRDGPLGEVEILGFFGFRARPQPVIGRSTKIRIHRVSLDVVGDPIESAVALNGIGPKAVLINGPAADGRRVPTKPNGMGGTKPVKPFDDGGAGLALDQEVIVVRHDAESEEAEGKIRDHLLQAGFKADIISDGLENGELSG